VPVNVSRYYRGPTDTRVPTRLRRQGTRRRNNPSSGDAPATTQRRSAHRPLALLVRLRASTCSAMN